MLCVAEEEGQTKLRPSIGSRSRIVAHHDEKIISMSKDSTETTTVSKKTKKSGKRTATQVTQLEQLGIGPHDIISSRSSSAFNHTGNRRFRLIIGMHLEQYNAAPSRRERSALIIKVVELIRENGSRFLRPTATGSFQELNMRQCREKVGHALRDMSVQQKAMEEKKSSKGKGSSSCDESVRDDDVCCTTTDDAKNDNGDTQGMVSMDAAEDSGLFEEPSALFSVSEPLIASSWGLDFCGFGAPLPPNDEFEFSAKTFFDEQHEDSERPQSDMHCSTVSQTNISNTIHADSVSSTLDIDSHQQAKVPFIIGPTTSFQEHSGYRDQNHHSIHGKTYLPS